MASQIVIIEMLNQKSGLNAGKLVDLAKWLRAQAEARNAIKDAGGTPSSEQQFIVDNPLAGGEIYLTSILKGVLVAYLETDRENIAKANLEALLQLYLNFRPSIERSWWLVDNFLLAAPQWTQARYPQLTADQKRLFLKDVNDARVEKALGLAADEESVPRPTAQEEIAYEAAYRFIVDQTPKP